MTKNRTSFFRDHTRRAISDYRNILGFVGVLPTAHRRAEVLRREVIERWTRYRQAMKTLHRKDQDNDR